MTIRVLLADDNEITRWGVKAIIDSSDDIRVVAQCPDGQTAVREAASGDVDVAVLDLSMPGLDGLSAAREILAQPDPPPVVILTAFHDDAQVQEALRAGVSGFLLKDTAPQDLLAALRAAAAGHATLGPTVARRLVDQLAQHTARVSTAERGRLQKLTGRELNVLALLANGLTNASIGKELGMTEGTVKGHVGSILTKLGLDSRVQAARLAYRAGIGGQ